MTTGNFTILARMNGVHSLRNGDLVPSEQQGIFANNIEYVSFTPEVIYTAKDKYGVSLSVGGAFSGKQILASPAFEGGLFLKF